MQIEPTAPDEPASRPQDPASLPAGRYRRWKGIFGTALSFFVGQGALQAVNALIGLYLVRSLTVEAYAQFGLAFGFQSTAGSLMDLGFASTIIPLVGNRIHDRDVVGRYVHSALRLRTRAFFLFSPLAVFGFVAVAHNHHWSAVLQILLIVPVLVALYSSGNVSCYSAPFFLHRRLSQYYLPQTVSALFRFAAYIVFRILGGLNAWTAAALSALNVSFVAGVLAKKSREWISWDHADTRATEREIVHYVKPAIPALLFGALQPQISLFLISIFGQTTGIAEVAALGRIAQLFAVLQTFNIVVIEPYIARLDRDRLLAVYLKLMLWATMACIPVVAIAFIYPKPVVWILGSKYAALVDVIGWQVMASCVTYIAVLAWVMNRARKWVFWSGTIFEIVLILAVQTAFILVVGVRTTREAVMFTFVSSVCLVVSHAYNAVYGFLKGPRATLAAADGVSSLLR